MTDLKSCQNALKKKQQEISSSLGEGFKEVEAPSVKRKIHDAMKLYALENDDHNRKNTSFVDPYPNTENKETVKGKDGKEKEKVMLAYYTLNEVHSSKSKKKPKKSSMPTRKKKKPVVYEDEDDDTPNEESPNEEDTKDNPKKLEKKRYTLDLGKDGQNIMHILLRLLVWEVHSAIGDCDLPTNADDIGKLLDEKISDNNDFNVYQLLVHVSKISLVYRPNLFNLDTQLFNIFKKYSGNPQIALHVSNLFAHFCKVVAIHSSNMGWHNKSLKRMNTNIFAIIRNLEIGIERQSTVSSGLLDKVNKILNTLNEIDDLKRSISKSKKDNPEKPDSDKGSKKKEEKKKVSKKKKSSPKEDSDKGTKKKEEKKKVSKKKSPPPKEASDSISPSNSDSELSD